MQGDILVITLNANERAALFSSRAKWNITLFSAGVLGGHVLLISFCGQRNRVAGGCVRTATAIKSEESQNETFIHVQG